MAEAIDTFEPGDERPIKIFFQDEARFGRICQPVKCWVPKGIRPIVPKQIIRDFIYVYSAVCPWDGESFSLLYGNMDSECMSSFLNEFSRYYKDYRTIMIMDRAGCHNDKTVNQFENIRIIKQVSRCPELNPVEHLWEHIKENYLHNKYWETLEGLEEDLCKALNLVFDDKYTIKSLTGFHWVISHTW